MAVAGSLTYDTKLDTKGFQGGLSKVGSATKGLLAGIGVAVGATVTAIAGITVASTKAYAEYEQLVGGVDTLFKESSKQLQKYADEAYKTAGLSANQYMSTVTSFSASLLQSLGGDTKQATEYANQAVIDMSDNANKMGTSMEAIQFAYQGFAKQNYTMLDNLKLGYGGTKTEMERLIADANRVKEANGEMADLSINSFADVTEAIHIIQTEMGITGTTAKEASTTITGSINAMKGSWENLLVALGSGKGIEEAINNLFDSISTVANNVMPVVMTILEQVPTFITQLITVAVEQIPTVVEELIPTVLNSAVTILNTLIQGIQDNLQTIVNGAMTIVMTLLNTTLDMLPQILEMGITILLSLIQGIVQAIPDLIPAIIECINTMLSTLIKFLPDIIIAGFDLLMALVFGIIDNINEFIDAVLYLIGELIATLMRPDMLTKIIMAGIQLVMALIVGLIKAIPDIVMAIPKIIASIVNTFRKMDWAKIGKDILKGIINGFLDIGNLIWNAVKKVGNSMLGSIKKFFGIASPSKLMRDQVGKFIPQGIAVGIEADTDKALNSIDKMNDEIMNKMNQAVNMEMAKASFSGTSGSVSQILSANSMIQVENNNKLYLDGEQIYDNQQTVQQRKNLQYGFGGGTSR